MYNAGSRRLAHVTTTLNGPNISRFAYAYDKDGNVIRVVDEANANQMLCFTYDNRSRLTLARTGNDACTAYNGTRGDGEFEEVRCRCRGWRSFGADRCLGTGGVGAPSSSSVGRQGEGEPVSILIRGFLEAGPDHDALGCLELLHRGGYFEEYWLFGAPSAAAATVRVLGSRGEIVATVPLDENTADVVRRAERSVEVRQVGYTVDLDYEESGTFVGAVDWETSMVGGRRVVSLSWSLTEGRIDPYALTDRYLHGGLDSLVAEVLRIGRDLPMLAVTALPPNLPSLLRYREFLDAGRSGAVPLPGVVTFLSGRLVGPWTEQVLARAVAGVEGFEGTVVEGGVLGTLQPATIERARALEAVLVEVLDGSDQGS